ncbi:MAG TPA: four helix bundle protein [Acidimicrobiia bacterium]|nr:four helix bundle protein [Acidimicrobiia bacterium]
MQDFRKLRVWHESIELAAAVYEMTRRLPRSERYGITAQVRGAAVSISSNIAEGCGRPSRKDFARFLGIAIGSASELESQLYIIARLGLLEDDHISVLVRRTAQCRKRLIALYQSVGAAISTQYPEPTTHYSLDGR